VFDEVVEAARHDLERWSVPDGETPDPAQSYDAVMVFGGSAHPDQDDHFAWLGHEEKFLEDVLAERIPVFGVCLGAQMLARAAGAKVRPANAPEVGWLDVELTPEGESDPVLGVLPRRAKVFQWHHYTFAIPEGGSELARSDVCSQAFRLAQSAWGIQFHAEVTLPMVTAWASEDQDDLPMTFEAVVARSEAEIGQSNDQGRALCSAFLREAAAG
jgi:GMP synthase (glutamine-hydrolysing)